MSRRRRLARILLGALLLPMSAAPAVAQLAVRATGETLVAGLESARQELATRANHLPQSDLAATAGRIDGLVATLRKALGKDAGSPVDLLDADARTMAYRAQSVLQRTQDYLQASQGCLDADAGSMAEALARNVELVLAGKGSAKQPASIRGVETADQRPLFVLRESSLGAVFALDGVNLFDARCEDPVVTATDAQGRRLPLQPQVTGVSPTRLELKLPEDGQLSPGTYVLHVASRRKALLVGCAAQPEAVAALQVAATPRAVVDYSVVATCRAASGERRLPPVTGAIPAADGGVVSQAVVIEGCDDPVRYTVAAKVSFDGGAADTVGPFSQTASAGITAGLPGGLSMSWDPSVRQLFVRPAASTCKGVY